MVEFEADDALSSATARFKNEAEVEQIVICSPDKDLAQLVSGSRIVGWDRRRNRLIDEAGVVEKFGVRPPSIPDWLGLVGDAADGLPGLPGWGKNPPPPCWHNSSTSRPSPPIRIPGGSQPTAPRGWPRAWRSTGRRRCCSAGWRRCARM